MYKCDRPPMATWLVLHRRRPHAALFGQVAMDWSIHRPGGSARPEPCAGENLREEVGVSSLKGQPGQAKGLGKCSTWNILYWLICASHYACTIGVIPRE